MVKKIVIFICYVICFSSAIYSMDDANSGSPDQKTSPGENAALSRRKSDERIRMTPPVPNLHMNAVVSGGSSSMRIGRPLSGTGSKATVDSLEELKDHVQKARSTHRSAVTQRTSESTQHTPNLRKTVLQKNVAMPTKQRAVLDPEKQDVVIDMGAGDSPLLPQKTRSISPEKRRSLLPAAFAKGDIAKADLEELLDTEVLDEREYLPADAVWQFLAHANPGLSRLREAHNLNFDEMKTLAAVFAGVKVTPKALIEFAKEHSDILDKPDNNSAAGYFKAFCDLVLPTDSPDDDLIKRFEKLEKMKPNEYEALAFELLKGVCDQADGQHTNLPLISTAHMQVQNDQVNAQQAQIRQQWVGTVLSTLTAIGTTAWALFGQIKAAPCTNSTG